MLLVRIGVTLIVVLSMATGALGATDLATAVKESTISGEFRNYFFQRDFEGGTTDKEDFAVGGRLHFETGSIYGINVGLSFYTSQGMGLNDDGKDVYGLLAKDDEGDHESYTALGESYIQGVFGKTTIKIGRQEMRTPWINVWDCRLTPQSNEAYTINNKTIPGFEFIASHVNRIKRRTATSFISMSEAAIGPNAEDEPVTLGGIIFTGVKGLKLQFWDYYAYELMNAPYFRADCNLSLDDKFSLFAALQYLDEEDIGDSIGGDIDTNVFGMKAGFEAYGARLTLGYAKVGEQNLLRPWGHDLIVSFQVNNADRADEEGLMASLAYDFSEIGLQGFSAYVRYADFDTPDSGATASADRDEIDFNMQYNFSGFLKGLSLRARYAIIDEDEVAGGEDFNDFRFYLRYKFGFSPEKWF